MPHLRSDVRRCNKKMPFSHPLLKLPAAFGRPFFCLALRAAFAKGSGIPLFVLCQAASIPYGLGKPEVAAQIVVFILLEQRGESGARGIAQIACDVTTE